MSDALAASLDALPRDVLDRLGRHGFDRARFLRLAARVGRGGPIDNRVAGRVEPPAPGDVADLPDGSTLAWQALECAGLDVLSAGQCALIVLAGGMATRMGGVVKALVEAIPGHSFLALREREMAVLSQRAGRRAPLWLMSSAATDGALRQALGARLDGQNLAVFSQDLSLRVTPEGELFLDERGACSEHAPGHGDLPDALRRSGLLEGFVARGGRLVVIANLDNLGATVDPVILGWHLAHGHPLTCEVVDKLAGDRGGIPVRLDGRPVVLEEFRLPRDFDPTTVRVFNTNTFVVDARALLDLRMDWTFFAVEKQVGGRKAIQFERLIGELTSQLETRFLRLPRDGSASRFLPVKDQDELVARRSAIELVARARGLIS